MIVPPHPAGPAVVVRSVIRAMKPYSENTQTFTDMFEGLARAIERFDVAVKDRDPAKTFIPLFEMLNWAVALDDRARKRWCPEGEPLDWGWREKVIGAHIMSGVRFVRNSVHHQWSDALELDEGGFGFPLTFPMVFFEWRWRPASDLPEPEKRHQDKWWREGKEVYEANVQGEMARLTIHQLANVFNHLRKLMELPPSPGLSTAAKLLAVQPNASAGRPREPPDEVLEATRR